MNVFVRAKNAAGTRWAAVKVRRPAVRHAVASWKRTQDTNANQYAAAITYFSFLALFPLLLLAVAVTGFVLHSHPATLQSLFDRITTKAPGTVGTTLRESIKTAIAARTSVGIVGLLGVLLTGLGWIGNLRSAIDAVWDSKAPSRNFFVQKLANLGVLAGLGLGILVSLGLTVVGTALTGEILRALSLGGLPGVHALVTVLGLLLAVLGDMIIFWWLLIRLPGVAVTRSLALRGTLLAAVGFEALKVAGTYTIASTAHSATAGPFAGLLGILIWIQLVARFMLYCAAWMSTSTGAATLANVAVGDVAPGPAGSPAAEVVPGPACSPAALGAALVGAGAVAGAAVVWTTARVPLARRRLGPAEPPER